MSNPDWDLYPDWGLQMVESQPGMVGGSKKSSNWLVILLVEAFDLSDGNAAASCIAAS